MSACTSANTASHSATYSVSTGTMRMASAPPGVTPSDASTAPIMAAGAASTPKMNSRVVLSIANSRIGTSDPYSP